MKSKHFSLKTLPLFALAMMIVATGVAQSKSTSTQAQEKAPDVTINLVNDAPTQENPDGTPKQTAKISFSDKPETVTKESAIADCKEPFYSVSEMPKYNDKENPLHVQVMRAAKYPAELLKDKVEGIVIVQVVVEKDGTFTNPTVISSVHPKLDAEALRVVRDLKNTFTPGKQNGEVVRCYYQIPVPFLYAKK